MLTKQTDQAVAINADDIARELNISRSLAYQVMKSKGFPSIRIGVKRIICYRKDFEKWLAGQKK